VDPKQSVDGDRNPPAPAQRLARRCAGAACGIALLALAGWLFGARILAGQWGRLIPMAPITALALCFLGGGVFSQARWPAPRLSRKFALAAAGLAATLALLVLVQLAAGVDAGVESALARTSESVGRIPLGRMSPWTAFSLILESGALLLLLLAARRRWAASLAALLALPAAAMNLVVLVGYAYGAPLLYGGGTVPVALPTALAFVLLGVAQIGLALPGVPGLGAWTGESIRGVLLRAFMPGLLAVILLAGWLGTASWASGTVNPALWHSVEAIVVGVLVVAVIAWAARRTGDTIERAQEALRESESRHRASSRRPWKASC
jgi:hypothetical protein